jgi:hypothetical protein
MLKKINILFLVLVLNLNISTLIASRVDSIDIIHYNIETNLRNLSSKQISGSATLVALVKFDQTKSLVLDLLKFSVGSVQCNGIATTFSQTDSTLHLRLGQTYKIGDTLRMTIEYAGAPTLDARWGGFYFSGNYAYNMGVGMASNPVNFGRCWYPCIDNFTDKATYEFHITTDSGYMAVCNGIQSPVTPAANKGLTWHWRLEQEIPTYIANVAVSKYVLVNQVYQGMKRNIPITLAVEAKDTNNVKASFAKLNNALQCFEDKFGPYEFDRIGYVGVPFTSGAMEHAGNISYPLYAIDGSSTYETLMAHELSHHWFGNFVTASTAGDMWLNEGWASYCEAIFLECVYGRVAYDNKINSELFEVLRWAHVRDGGYIPVSGVPLAQTYGTHVYTKGSLMAHSLRMQVNNDTAFFNTCKSYLSKYRFKTASSADLQSHFKNRFGSEIDDFFNSYIYDKGHIDLQLERIEYLGDMRQSVPYFKLMSRHKTIIPNNLFVYLRYFTSPELPQFIYPVRLTRNPVTEEYVGPAAIYEANEVLAGINPGIMLGATTYLGWVKGNSVQSIQNVLLTITPNFNPITDSTYLIIQHHFAGPWIEKREIPKGIRVSSERYWHINGYSWDPNSKFTAFFNYDGTTNNKSSGHLDNELIIGTEDSLVLLYRPNAQSPFVVETDLTFQPGGSKMDKTGRFWINNLKKGDYVFGYRDIAASVNKIEEDPRVIKLYPNPSDSHVTVEFPANHASGTIKVIDMKGNVVFESKFTKNDLELKMNSSSWNDGNYVLIFEDLKGKITKNFIVK